MNVWIQSSWFFFQLLEGEWKIHGWFDGPVLQAGKKKKSLILWTSKGMTSLSRSLVCRSNFLIASWRRKWQPTPVFLPGNSHKWRSLEGYSPWGCRELGMTEHAGLSYGSEFFKQIEIFYLMFEIQSIVYYKRLWDVCK